MNNPYTSDSAFAYASNPGLGFLEDSMQSSMNAQADTGGAFSQVLNQMSAGISSGAQQGTVPMFGGGNAAQYNVNAAQAQRLGVKTFGGLTAAQLGQQMSVGGPASVIPYMGGNVLPQLIFPIAGLWTMYDGVKAVKTFRRDARAEHASQTAFNPSQLRYNASVQQMNSMNDAYAYLGPMH